MIEIKSEAVIINNSSECIFNFLNNFDNLGRLMPEQVINWKSNSESCSFTIKGMADLGLKSHQKNKYSDIVWKSDGKAPFEFTLSILLHDKNMDQAEAQIVLCADLSPMLKMMAVRPLGNFVNMLVNKLKELMELKV